MAQSSASDVQLQEQIRILELQLSEKCERLEELEAAILEDTERLNKFEELEQLEADLRERDLLDKERDEELRMLQEVLIFVFF